MAKWTVSDLLAELENYADEDEIKIQNPATKVLYNFYVDDTNNQIRFVLSDS